MFGRMRHVCAAMTACVAALLSGCVLGPVALEASRVRYNEVIQTTSNEQLLLNLVRLQYHGAPLFLEVGSVSAQFVFKESADVSGTIKEGPHRSNPDVLGLGAGVAYEERPTVTFTPLQGGDFVTQLLSPLQLDVVVLLSRSGWSIDRVLRLTVQRMNGLDNASTASGPTPARAPCYEEFARVARLFRELQKRGLLVLGCEARDVDVSAPLPSENLRLSDAIELAERGYKVRSADDGEHVILTRKSRVLVWRVPPAAAESVEVKEIVELLGLEPGRSAYPIREGITGQPHSLPGTELRTEITIATRSLMGTLFYLSQGVEVPEKHRQAGLVMTTRTSDGELFDWSAVIGSLLRVRSRLTRPHSAAVVVRHRGYWYYISDADLTTKSTFTLLSQLFALQAGEVEGAAPVLTLPVGG